MIIKYSLPIEHQNNPFLKAIQSTSAIPQLQGKPLLLTGKRLTRQASFAQVLYILELTLGFETNIQANSVRKTNKYTPLLQDLSSSNNKVLFINVSMGALGVMGSSCDSFLSLLQGHGFDKVTQPRIIMKTINIAIRPTYYIFCQRNKLWNNPELLNL